MRSRYQEEGCVAMVQCQLEPQDDTKHTENQHWVPRILAELRCGSDDHCGGAKHD